jgi:hypothetical protein
MRRDVVRNLTTLALLMVALTVVYRPEATRLLFNQAQSAPAGFVYVADLDNWQRTDREQTVIATAPLDLTHDLDDVPLNLGEWQGQDVPQTNVEVFILLRPEQYVERLYRDEQGHYLWLSLIGGRTSRTFHPPDLCYEADGWQTDLASHSIPLDSGQLHGLWLEAEKRVDGQSSAFEHLVFYFYLFPDANRVAEDGVVFVKVTTPRYGSTDETLAIQGRFLRQLFVEATPR